MPGRKSKKTRAKTRCLPPLPAFVGIAEKLGAIKAKIVDAASVITAPWVRLKCQFGCDGYASSLCCPPYTPTPSQMREVIDSYSRAILFETKRGKTKMIAAKLEREIFLSGYYKALGLGAGPCRLCGKCAYEDGCLHAEEARPSMEACGIDVYETARGNGFELDVVRSRDDVQHYYGLVLIT